MERPLGERRKERRIAGEEHIRVDLVLLLDVDLLDVSVSGVLFTSPEPLRVGQHAKLRTLLGEEPFAATVEIRRCTPVRGAHRKYYIGARFAALDDSMYRAVYRFLGQVENLR